MRVAAKIVDLKLVLIATISAAALACAACGPKAPYSEIKTDRTGGLAGQANSARKEVATMPATPATPVEPPSFVDSFTGQIKDLPMYPGSKRETMQYGPISGYESVMTRAKSNAAYDSVTKFYDDLVKKMGWTVISNDRSPDSFSWQLSKGGEDLAQVSVAKGTGNNSVYITISRSRRIAGGQPQPGAQPEGSK